MDAPPASEKDKETLSKHLLSHNFATITGKPHLLNKYH